MENAEQYWVDPELVGNEGQNDEAWLRNPLALRFMAFYDGSPVQGLSDISVTALDAASHAAFEVLS